MSDFGASEGTLERVGSTVHYWLSGPEAGPLVAFTHGASMDHHMFDEQVFPLVSEGYRTLTWDARGHGRSKPMGWDFSVPATADDLVALLDLLGYERVVLVGQSFGGFVAQETLFRYPERVDALVLIGSTDITASISAREMLALKLSPLIFRLWPYSDLKKRIAKNTAVKLETREYAYEAVGQLSKREFVTVWQAVANCLHSEPGHLIRRPMLLTHGEQDKTGNVAKIAPAWAEREPACRYTVIPDAGHNANQDNESFFNKLLLEFLQSITIAP